MKTHDVDVLIIGGGPAGYTAAIYAARANRTVTLVQGPQPGGQLTITTDVENYPGFADVIQGPWLMEQMARQAELVGTQQIADVIVDLDLSSRPFIAFGESGRYAARAIILATGAQARWLGLPGEERLRGFGVSGCAVCDGRFFRGATVAVIGGGNTAVEDALHLTHHAAKVYVVHRRDALRAERVLQDRLFSNPKVEVIWNSSVVEIVGEDDPPRVTGVRLVGTPIGGITTLPVDGVFVAIGHDPATELVRGKVELDSAGYVQTLQGSTHTSVPGLFAAGDVADRIYRQAITAAGMGCMAALDAERWLTSGDFYGTDRGPGDPLQKAS